VSDEPHDETLDIEDGPDVCWCGVENPELSDDLDATCGGSGVLHCHCGGDLCVCHWHGETPCDGCPDCEFDDDDFDYPDDDDPLGGHND